MLNEGMSERMTRLRQAFANSQQQIAAARAALNDISVRVESRDGRVSLTLDCAGQIKELDFRDDSYRDLAPRELSKKLVEVFAEAQAELRREVAQRVPPSPWTGLTVEQLLDSRTDASQIFSGGALESLLSSLNDGGRRR